MGGSVSPSTQHGDMSHAGDGALHAAITGGRDATGQGGESPPEYRPIMRTALALALAAVVLAAVLPAHAAVLRTTPVGVDLGDDLIFYPVNARYHPYPTRDLSFDASLGTLNDVTLNFLGEVGIFVEASIIGPPPYQTEFTTELELLGRPRRDSDPGTDLTGELDRHRADAARPAMDQEAFTGAKAATLDHVGPDGEGGFRQGRGLAQGGEHLLGDLALHLELEALALADPGEALDLLVGERPDDRLALGVQDLRLGHDVDNDAGHGHSS